MNNTEKTSFRQSDLLLKKYFSLVAGQCISAVCAFFASVAMVQDELSPFGIAVSGGISPEYVPASVLGCVAGAITKHGFSVTSLRYIASAVIAGIIGYVSKRNVKKQYHRHFSAIAGFFAAFSTGIILSISVSISLTEIVLYLAEGLLAGGAAYFINRLININAQKRFASRLTSGEIAAALVVFSIGVLSLRQLDFRVLSPAVIAGAYVIMLVSSSGGEKYSSLAGICAGVILGFSDKMGFVTGGFALSGLLCGIFGKRNRFITGVIMLLTTGITAFAAEDWLVAVHVMYDTGIAVVLLLLTPANIKNKVEHVFSLSSDGMFLSGQRNALSSRLCTASDGMSTVASSVKAVAGIYRRRSTPDVNNIYENVKSSVCASCNQFEMCHNRSANETTVYFSRIVETLKRTDVPSESELPFRFFSQCLTPEKVVSALSLELEKYRTAMRDSCKTGETVNIVSDQLLSTANLLKGMSDGMKENEEYDPEKSELITDVIENDMEVTTKSAGIFLNSDGKVLAEIVLPQARKKYDIDGIVEATANVLDITWEKPVITMQSDGTARIMLYEKTTFSAQFGGSQITSCDESWCGDTYDCFFDGRGNLVMILSDGMGTGKRAAADSVMCCSLASILIKSGFSFDSTLKVINSAMLVRSCEESLSTLDIAVINLYSGEVDFYKAGAGFSLVMRHNKLLKIEKPSLPVGILRDVALEKTTLNVSFDDTVVLLSDGVSEKAAELWKEILKNAADHDGRELPDKLSKLAVLNSDSEKNDDITVVTAVITRND